MIVMEKYRIVIYVNGDKMREQHITAEEAVQEIAKRISRPYEKLGEIETEIHLPEKLNEENSQLRARMEGVLGGCPWPPRR